MFTQEKIEELVDLLSTLDTRSKIYIGCDSVCILKKGKRYGRYATVCIVHKNGSNGCKIFSETSYEPDYDSKLDKPKLRMMNEVIKVCELYNQLIPYIDEFDIEIHLDISQDPNCGSNVAANEASGYVLGMTGVKPKLKPDSFASSFGADHIANKG